jgi:hypothetical protein
MKWLHSIKKFFAFVFLLGTFSSAHSAIIDFDYNFGDASLSGSFSYDDTTSVSLSGVLAGFTAYTPTSLNVIYSSGGTTLSWDLADHDPMGVSGFMFMPTIDPYDTWQTSEIRASPAGWANSNFVNSSGATLIFHACLSNSTSPSSWCDSKITITENDGTKLLQSTYGVVSPVPIPAAVWLFSTGLLGLVGIARRKHHRCL